MTRRRLRTECLAIALLAVVVTIPFVDVLFSDARFFVRDLTRYYHPTKKILREVVLAGEFPHWNRFYSAGQPMAANPEYEVFYPPQWLILLPDYDLGYRLHILIHVYIAAIGMYTLLRSLRLRLSAAMSGAISFGIGGLFFSYINLLPIMFAAAWVPWIGWLVLRALRSPTVARVGAAGFVLGIQALVGEPTTLVQTWAMVVFLAAWFGWGRGRWKGAAKGLTIAAIILAIGAAGGAVQLVTAADHVGDSARARPFSLGLVTTWSMPPARPLELVMPHVFGHLFGDGTYWGSGMYRNTASPFIYSIYLGLPILVFAAAAMAVKTKGRVAAAVVIAGSLILALGEHTPLYGILYELGLAQTVRYPEKFLFPGLLCVILLGAAGFDRFLRRDRVVRRVSIGVSFGLMCVSCVLLIASFSPIASDVMSAIWGIEGASRLERVVAISRADWAISLLRAATLCGLIWIAWEGRRTVWRVAMLAFILLDLTPVGVGVLPRVERGFFDPPAVASELSGDRRDFRIFHEVDWYGRGDIARKYFGTGRDVYWVVRNGMFPMTPANAGFQTVLERDYDKTALLPTIDFVAAMWQVRDAGQKRWREIFGAMSNVRYRAKYRPFDEESKRIERDLEKSHPVDFVEMDLTPRYYFAEQIEHLERKEDFARKLIRADYPARVAFVEFESFEPREASVESVVETANSARIVVETSGKSLLVASVTRNKYWSATVDGLPAKLEPVNIAYQGVVVEEGRHEVVMEYRNRLVLPMGIVSTLTLLGCLIAAIAPLLGRRSRTISA